jgi:hypothetical protein
MMSNPSALTTKDLDETISIEVEYDAVFVHLKDGSSVRIPRAKYAQLQTAMGMSQQMPNPTLGN